MAERSLATIRRVSSVDDIPGKDFIGLAHVDGWQVIVRKADIKADDLVVFCEIDSLLPDAEWCSFLKDKRIKTMKMAGVLSQGIAFPLSILPDGLNVIEGDDVTDVLGIRKWERPDATDVRELLDTKQKKKFPKWLLRLLRKPMFRSWLGKWLLPSKAWRGWPDFVSKTDETRIQNAPWYLDKDQEWCVTEKLDGQSGTFIVRRIPKKLFKRESFEEYVCSRNVRLLKPDGSSYWKVWEKYDLPLHLKALCQALNCEWVCIQGECIGPGIQGNKYKRKEPELYAFNFITSRDGRWASGDGKALLEPLGIPWVPIIGNYKLPKTVDGMLFLAHGESAIEHTLREGVVCRTLDGKQSFKAVDPEFLLRWGE